MATWLEITKVATHGGTGWEFGSCLWAPTHKNSKKTRSVSHFWRNVEEVEAGDDIIHLQFIGGEGAFVGHSIARSNGYVTFQRPTEPGPWEYAESFFRVDLHGYTEFNQPIKLKDFFENMHAELLSYLHNIGREPKNIFFTLYREKKKMQCIQGAYLSILDSALLLILASYLSPYDSIALDNEGKVVEGNDIITRVSTSGVMRKVLTRQGQSEFANNVKKNFRNQCCFPECTVVEKDFLIGAHIARWADDIDKRGDVTNGLCFCPQHDKAFELGYFTFDEEYQVALGKVDVLQTQLFKDLIKPYLGMLIKDCQQKPDIENLRQHRKRIGLES